MSHMIAILAETIQSKPVRDFADRELDELRRREAVRTILQRLRRPTEAMRAAGDQLGQDASPREIWEAMIDAALKS